MLRLYALNFTNAVLSALIVFDVGLDQAQTGAIGVVVNAGWIFGEAGHAAYKRGKTPST